MAKNITRLKHRFPIRQIRRIPRFFRLYWPVLFLVAITTLLAFLNYEPGTFLIGWDNLNPEFDLFMNIKRSLFSVWQEHRGLGLLAGQAHSADLPRILLIWLLQSFKIPVSLLRYLTTFLPLILGPLGVYFLFYHHLFREKLDAKTTQFASFLGALFYLLNLNTLQTFFVPFETFTWFYGAFPWLLFFLIFYLHKPSIGKLFTLFLVSLISAPSFYVETIFLVFLVSIVPFIIEFFTQKRQIFFSAKTIISALSSLIVPQLFWLLPIIFFVFTGSHVAENAKINQISSPQTYFRNLEFANLADLALMKGYLFNYLDMGAGYKYDYLLSVWRNHLNNPLISIIGYLIFAVVLTGLYYSLKKKFAWTASFICVLFLSLFFLLGGGLLINSAIPLIGELFRSPFTKFSIPLSFAFAFFFSIGTVFILDLFTYLHSRLTYILTLFSVAVSLLIFMSPTFSGNLIGSGMRLQIPGEYFELFSYLKTQDPSTRIANLPQYTFWGWNYYDWGYRGSGFLWHGIKQPLLDRAFDVWDKSSEKYYEELSSALYSGNSEEFAKVLDKYSVNWILLDKHVISPDGQTDLGYANLEKFLSSSKFSLDKNFSGQIYLYRVTLNEPVKNFLSLTPPPNSTHPFADLSYRPNIDWVEKGGYLSLSTPLVTLKTSPLRGGTIIHLPSLTETEKLIPVKVDYRKFGHELSIRLSPITPVIFVDAKQYDISSDPTNITIPVSSTEDFILQIHDQYFSLRLPAELPDITDYLPLSQIYLPTGSNFTIALYSAFPSNSYPLTNALSQTDPVQCYTDKSNRKIEKIVSPDGISLLGTDVNGCLSVEVPVASQQNLISYSFTYFSPGLIPGSVNISGRDFVSPEITPPLEPSTVPKQALLFTHSTGKYQQLNLVLEAEGTKSIQEITYQDITASIHPVIYSSAISLKDIPSQDLVLDFLPMRAQVSLPLTATQFDNYQTAESNSLLPQDRNCDQFNKGETVKIVSGDGFFYQSQNAIQCDSLNLRHFSHSLNYLLSFYARNQSGLSLTTCLENYSTRRCDVFERLAESNLSQSIIQPIANPDEAPGYTLHLFNESIGKRISSNLLTSIKVRPIPLNFLKNITLSKTNQESGTSNLELSSTHPSEYFYTLSLSAPGNNNQEPGTINLFQTRSPYWKAVSVSPSNLTKIFFIYPSLTPLTPIENEWHNSWILPKPGTDNPEPITLAIIYFPQYLEFLGLSLIPFSLIVILVLDLSSRRQKKTPK